MTGRLLDISSPLSPDMVVWPGSPGVQVDQLLALAAGDEANVSRLSMDVHSGTHIDAPKHMLDGHAAVDSIGLETLVGPAVVANVPKVEAIGPRELEALEIDPSVRRLLLRTRNSDGGVRTDGFDDDFCALSADGARWLVDRGVELVGIDYLSIQRYHDSAETHEVLLAAGTVILEGLDLRHVAPGRYTLLCLPLALPGAEAAPARAVLVAEEENGG
jgi:arylformamidase